VGVHRISITALELRKQSPTLGTLDKLATALGVTVAGLDHAAYPGVSVAAVLCRAAVAEMTNEEPLP
jgi:transcriptional regulator with XRE-family HTH domain